MEREAGRWWRIPLGSATQGEGPPEGTKGWVVPFWAILPDSCPPQQLVAGFRNLRMELSGG